MFFKGRLMWSISPLPKSSSLISIPNGIQGPSPTRASLPWKSLKDKGLMRLKDRNPIQNRVRFWPVVRLNVKLPVLLKWLPLMMIHVVKCVEFHCFSEASFAKQMHPWLRIVDVWKDDGPNNMPYF